MPETAGVRPAHRHVLQPGALVRRPARRCLGAAPGRPLIVVQVQEALDLVLADLTPVT